MQVLAVEHEDQEAEHDGDVDQQERGFEHLVDAQAERVEQGRHEFAGECATGGVERERLDVFALLQRVLGDVVLRRGTPAGSR